MERHRERCHWAGYGRIPFAYTDRNILEDSYYSVFPIKRTVFFTSVAVHKNTVRLIGNIEYWPESTYQPFWTSVSVSDLT